MDDVVTAPRHKHKRPAPRPHLRPVVVPVAAIALVVSGSVAASSVETRGPASAALTSPASAPAALTRAAVTIPGPTRVVEDRPSRGGGDRARLAWASPVAITGAGATAVAEGLSVTGTRYATTALNVRTGASEGAEAVTVLPAGGKVSITGVRSGVWAQLLYAGKPRWVKADYLTSSRPAPATKDPEGPATTGSSSSAPSTPASAAPSTAPSSSSISGDACPDGSAVESGLRPNTIAVHRAVCARYPAVSSYGGLRADGEHSLGQALDIMVSSSSLGGQIADWVRANAGRLGVTEVIWSQHIWTTQRSSEGWRAMPDRGSSTANHYDHVHVTTG